MQNGTSFFYFATDHWRYEKLNPATLAPPWEADRAERHPADYNIIAARLGLGCPPTRNLTAVPSSFARTPEAMAPPATADMAYVVNLLKVGPLESEDPNHPLSNYPRVMFFWRANVLGASNRGTSIFLKHLLAADDAVLDEENQERRPQEMPIREADPQGKLDLLVTSELRMNTSALYSDVVLPAATCMKCTT